MTNCTAVEKVIVPKVVADSIAKLRRSGYNNTSIFNHLRGRDLVTLDIAEAQGWVYRKEASDTLMEALVNGYEIERTPHDELREYYEEHIAAGWPSDSYVESGKRKGIKEALRILGIKVEGINA